MANRLTEELKASFAPDVLLPSVIAGIVAGILAITFMFSYSALIFSDELSSFVPRATGNMLFGAVVISLAVAVFGALRGAVALPQDNPTAIIAILVATTIAALPAGENLEQTFLHTSFVIIASTIVGALLFIVIGHWRLANLVQYIPYPVVGGFLAGTGWLLFKGSFSVMADVPLELARIDALVERANLWVPGALFAFATLFLTSRITHFLVMPALIFGAVLVFYAIFFATDTSIDQAISQGWLLEPFGGGGLWQPIRIADLTAVDLGLVWDQIGGIGTILVIAVISVLLNLTALESAFGKDIDINREMRTVGFANIGAALGGGLIGYHYVSLSTLGHRMNGDSRVVGVVVALVCFLALAVGADALSYFPKFVLGGLVMFVGLSFLNDWVVKSWGKLAWPDFGIILLILFVVETIGFLEGVAVGITAAAVLFVISYSRISVVRHTLSGSEVHSNIERPATQRSILEREGKRILLLKLHGYIFFATAIGLVRKITDRLAGREQPLEYLIFDFQHVTGLDTSALHGFAKMRQRAVENDVRILFTHMPAQIHDQFEREGFYTSDGVVNQRFDDMDHALEWSEAHILEAQGLEARPDAHPLDHQLAEIFDTAEEQERFRAYLQRLEIPEDELLFHEHEKDPALYFVESGELSEYLDREDTASFRLRRVGAGSLLGAAAFFRRGDSEEMVSVRADKASVAYSLSRNAVERMAREDPQLLLELQSYVLHFLSDRLAANLDLLRSLLMVEE